MFRKALFLSAIATSSILISGIAQAQSQDAQDNNRVSRPAIVNRSLVAPSVTAQPQFLFAVVNSNGSLARGLGVVSSGPTGLSGNYEVIFNRDVRQCAYVATIGGIGTFVPAPGEITVTGRGGNNNGVFLTLKNSAGNRAANSFHLLVTCPN